MPLKVVCFTDLMSLDSSSLLLELDLEMTLRFILHLDHCRVFFYQHCLACSSGTFLAFTFFSTSSVQSLSVSPCLYDFFQDVSLASFLVLVSFLVGLVNTVSLHIFVGVTVNLSVSGGLEWLLFQSILVSS